MESPYRKMRIRYALKSNVPVCLWIAIAAIFMAGGAHTTNALSSVHINQFRSATSPLYTRGASSATIANNFKKNNDLSSNRLFRRRSRIQTSASSGRLPPNRMSSSPMAHADLAVRLDQPVLSSTQFRSATNMFTKSILAVLVSDVFKTALVAFAIALFITAASKSTKQASKLFKPITSAIKHSFRLAKGKYTRFTDRFHTEAKGGVPMMFEGDPEDCWGVCTLSSVKPIERSQYIEYEFKLPKEENILQLALGQQLSLCCLDSADNVAKRNYYVYSPKNTRGQFSIITTEYEPEDDVEMKKRRARGEGDFDQVLATELQVGDEIALQPGPRTLDYKGEYLPVTDMVYFAAGDGIVPVIDQVKSVLPPGSSSVKGVSVVWTNDDEKDFDIALSMLEDEYFKYSTKLAVSCVVEDGNNSLKDNSEIDDSVPKFTPGTMAVVSGPREFAVKAIAVLMSKGYPENCICVLPSE